MEYAILVQVGAVIDWVVKGGYCLAGVYMFRTGVRYVQDYKMYTEKERSEVK